MVRRYRPPASQLVPWLFSSAMFVLIGLGALTQSLHRIGVGGVIVAVLVVVVGCMGAALRLSANVTLTAAELSYRHNFRRRAIPWPSVESFRVMPAPGWGRWWCVAVEVSGRGGVRIPVVGSRKYAQRVMEEIEEYKAGLGSRASQR